MTLRSRLLVLTLATLAPMVIFGIAAAGLIVQRERAVFERGATERTLALITAVDTELSGHVSSLQLLASSRNLQAGKLKAFYREVLRKLPTQPNWRDVSLALASGERIFESGHPIGADLPPIEERSSFDEVLRKGEPVIGNLTADGGRSIFKVRVPATGPDASAYVLSASVDPRAILALLTPQRLPADWVGVVLDANRRIVARTMNNEGMLGRLASESLQAALNENSEGWFHGSTLEGTEVYSPYNRSAATGWTVAIGIPAPVVTAGESRAMWMLAFGVLAAVTLAILLAGALSRRITEPISALAAAARALGQGKPVEPPTDGLEEVREVSRALVDAAAAVRDREEALRAADRAKDEFLAMLSHELRNPLSALSAAAQVLHLTGPKEGPSSQAVDVVGRQVDHMARLVEDLLDVSRVTTGKVSLLRRPMDLAEVVRGAVRAMRAGGRFAQHEVRVDATSVWVDADAARVEQIVSNLLGNAIKYTPAGGEIVVRVLRRNDTAAVEVADSGIGIAPDLIPRVFDLFVQGDRSLDRAPGGLGVGLTLVKQLAELHGGSVTVTSDGPGKGACFTVSFKAIEKPMQPDERDEGAFRASRCHQILLVEDNADARRTLATALALNGHAVSEASDGTAAVAAAAIAMPDAVLVDIGLPGMDGFEVAQRLRSMPGGDRMLLIALTGYGQPEVRAQALKSGFDAYLTKPASFEKLAEIIERGTNSRGVRSAESAPQGPARSAAS